MSLDPRALQVFRAVCQEKSISGAARALNLSQPSVSVAMNRLEDTLSTRLFERHRSGIQLTPEGRALERHAMALDNLLDSAVRDVELASADVSGSIIVGGTPGALATLVPRVVQSMLREIPRFQMRVLERPDTDLEDQLRSREIDIGVVTAASRQRPDDVAELSIMQDPFSLLVGRSNFHLPDVVSLLEVQDARWVLPDAVGAFNRQIEALFMTAHVSPPLNVIRCDSLLTTKAIVRATDLITILPRRVAEMELRAGSIRALDIKEARMQRQVGILWLKGQNPSPLTERFIAHAKRIGEA